MLEAVTSLGVQKDVGGPIRKSAIHDATSAFVQAMTTSKNCVEAFDKLEHRCAGKSEMQRELASIYLERGGLRKLVAVIILHLRPNDQNVADEWLRPATRDLLAAVAAVEIDDSPGMTLLQLHAAFEGRVIAEVLADKELLTQFERVVESHRSSGKNAEEFARLESACEVDVLRTSKQKAPRRAALRNADEETIKLFADSLMKATGYPKDRRRYVEDDVRKMARIDAIQAEFCQHLQPLQNLGHTRSPNTIYARPTEYVCSCTLLGHETVIEFADIDVVIDAMQRTYCSGCDKRAPLDQQG
jgi:hypothetical protein